MKGALITLFLMLALLFSCKTSAKREQREEAMSHHITQKADSSEAKNRLEEVLITIPQNIKPVFGYRFTISGDFDGNGTKERLTEHYYSGLDNKETNKFYDSLPDYEQLVALTVKKEPFSFVSADSKYIDTLRVFSGGQLLGLSWLKNEGDLNGDGTDEVSYVINWADWSNLNTWHIVTYKNNKWTEVYSFPIWDSQLPELPQNFNHYDLSLHEQQFMNTTSDTMDRRIEKEFLDFKGLVRKIKTNQIQVIARNDEAAEDTVVIDLKRLK